jgi:hypothetical protein
MVANTPKTLPALHFGFCVIPKYLSFAKFSKYLFAAVV